ncbi:MAG: hypothetical protein KKF74_01105 [Nanoarchaeota archaeon]|nr:hypothetical protein [Nanoarchaeota archaeon]
MADLKEFKFKEEKAEDAHRQKDIPTGYPVPLKRYWLSLESPNQSIEEFYFWVVGLLRNDLGYNDVEKLMDVFAASQHSAFFGVAMQRTGIYQDKVSQFLATIGKMVKELFQLVREIRILDERLGYYKDSYDAGSKSRESAEITLKGIWIDMVEGGAKSPASVYGMARELEFTVLPDLFFSTHPATSKDVDDVVNKLEFNRKVKEVLKRKLRAFLEWKENTYKELKTRRKFTLKFLRQHYDAIKMYMSWVKPYLKYIRMLRSSEKKMDSPDLIGAFEGSMIEIEILAKKSPFNDVTGKTEDATYKACILANFNYRTTPDMKFVSEGYQRGPTHIGRVDMKLRSYAWSEKEIENYKTYRAKEDMELLGEIDPSISAAMEALGEEFEIYLREAGEELNKKEEKPKKQDSIFEPFTSILSGFKEIGTAFTGIKGSASDKPSLSKFEENNERNAAGGEATGGMWLIYKNFRKAHGMIAW